VTIIVVALYFDNSISGAASTDDKILYIYVRMYLKVKAVPLQAWSGPEGSRKLRFPIS